MQIKNQYISSKKIYSRILLKIEDKDVFPPHFFNKKNILYSFDKTEPFKNFAIVNIKESIHFKYLINKESHIKNYMNYISSAQQSNHSVESFNFLIDNFDLNELKKNKVVLKKIKYKKRTYYEIIDGCHRLSIYFTKYKKIPSKYYLLADQIH